MFKNSKLYVVLYAKWLALKQLNLIKIWECVSKVVHRFFSLYTENFVSNESIVCILSYICLNSTY